MLSDSFFLSVVLKNCKSIANKVFCCKKHNNSEEKKNDLELSLKGRDMFADDD